MTTTRYARIQVGGDARYVEVQGDLLQPLSGAPWAEGTKPAGRPLALAGATFLPVSDASKVVCIGQNYRKHAEEMGKPVPNEPLLFIKPSTALNGHEQPIRLPPESNEVHHESELAVVIGRRLHRASVEEAERAIFAFTCFNDVTARDIQRREVQHTRGKSYDTFACAGPWMVTGLAADDLRIQCRVDGAIRQDGRTSDMVFTPARLVSFISSIMTLLPGDLVSTGTPSGVGPIVHGQLVEVEIEGIGTLRNPVLGNA